MNNNTNTDLTFLECIDHIEDIMSVDIDDDQQETLTKQVESSLPGSNVNDLMWFPDSWFNDAEMAEVDLSSREIVEYLMVFTGKRLVGAEQISLPKLPSSMDGIVPRTIGHFGG